MPTMRKLLREYLDNAATWPDARVTIRLFPWEWHLKPDVWRDGPECNGFALRLEWLFVEFWIGWNDPAFIWEREQ